MAPVINCLVALLKGSEVPLRVHAAGEESSAGKGCALATSCTSEGIQGMLQAVNLTILVWMQLICLNCVGHNKYDASPAMQHAC